MSKETSAPRAAITQHGAAAFHRMRCCSMAVWTSKAANWLGLVVYLFYLVVMVFHHLNCQKHLGNTAVSFNSVLLHNWTQHCTAVRDLGNRSLSSALIPSFLSQGERSDTGRGSWWILRFHGPVLSWAVWRFKLCCLEKVCTGATPARGSPAPT